MDERYPELDAVRGIAVLSMVIYHLCFDLAYFYNWDIPIHEGWYALWARGTATVFLLVMGTCFVISWNRRSATRSAPSAYLYYIKRGLIIFVGGMLISLVTWFVAPNAFVKFGILHLIGISALIQPLFVRLGVWNAALGIAIQIVGIELISQTTYSKFLFPLGIPYPGFLSLDYYPLIPWFGVVLLGMGIGSVLYVPERKVSLKLKYPKWLLWTGRKALILYFLHQPLLIGILALAFGSPIS